MGYAGHEKDRGRCIMPKGTQEAPVRVPVSDSWKRLILWVGDNLPHGELTVRIVEGSPTDLVSFNQKIRFDRALPGGNHSSENSQRKDA